jgi:uncharacterized membrane protein
MSTPPETPLPNRLHDNIEKISSLTHRYDDEAGRHQRFVERVTSAIARPGSLYAMLSVVAGWTIFNIFSPQAFDPPPFYALQGLCSLTALLISTMVLITQRRQGHMARRREQLELQVNMLTEQKATKLIALLEELRRDLPNVRNREDKTADEMAQSPEPDAVVQALEQKVLADLEREK